MNSKKGQDDSTFTGRAARAATSVGPRYGPKKVPEKENQSTNKNKNKQEKQKQTTEKKLPPLRSEGKKPSLDGLSKPPSAKKNGRPVTGKMPTIQNRNDKSSKLTLDRDWTNLTTVRSRGEIVSNIKKTPYPMSAKTANVSFGGVQMIGTPSSEGTIDDKLPRVDIQTNGLPSASILKTAGRITVINGMFYPLDVFE